MGRALELPDLQPTAGFGQQRHNIEILTHLDFAGATCHRVGYVDLLVGLQRSFVVPPTHFEPNLQPPGR